MGGADRGWHFFQFILLIFFHSFQLSLSFKLHLQQLKYNSLFRPMKVCICNELQSLINSSLVCCSVWLFN